MHSSHPPVSCRPAGALADTPVADAATLPRPSQRCPRSHLALGLAKAHRPAAHDGGVTTPDGPPQLPWSRDSSLRLRRLRLSVGSVRSPPILPLCPAQLPAPALPQRGYRPTPDGPRVSLGRGPLARFSRPGTGGHPPLPRYLPAVADFCLKGRHVQALEQPGSG